MTVNVEARVPGEFEEELTFYTDRPSQPTLILRVRGIIQGADHDHITQATRP